MRTPALLKTWEIEECRIVAYAAFSLEIHEISALEIFCADSYNKKGDSPVESNTPALLKTVKIEEGRVVAYAAFFIADFLKL